MKRKQVILIASTFTFTLLLIDSLWIYALGPLDQMVLDLTKSLWSESTNQIVVYITNLSGKIAVPLFSLGLIVILSILKKWDLLIFSMMSLVGCIFLSLLFKSIVGRIRPISKMYDPGEFSFPSGHATLSMCMCLTLYLIIKGLLAQRSQTHLLAIFLSFPIVISFTRVYLHVHYLSDVIGGMALAMSWVLLMSYIYLPNEFSKTRQV